MFRICRDIEIGRVWCDNIKSDKWSKPNTKSVKRSWKTQEDAQRNLDKISDKYPDAKIVEFSREDNDKPIQEEPDYTPDLKDMGIDPFLIDDETGQIDEMYLFRNLNSHCLKCVKACKQSSMATIVRCPLFTMAA